MERIVLIGSGASAVHFALSVLERGGAVTMIDVGRERPEPVRPDDDVISLKENLEDPAAYFLGENFESMLYPGKAGEFYGFPPHKQYIFEGVPQYDVRTKGFEPLSSFARGGLGEAWTGAAFPFSRGEMVDFPLAYHDFAAYYGRVAERIGISGAEDDLARFVPLHQHLGQALDLDEHSAYLLKRYKERRPKLNDKLGCWIGRSRIATFKGEPPRGSKGRKGCDYLGRCLWTCPRDALYTPSMTLRVLQEMEGFTYVPNTFVTHFEMDDAQRATKVVGEHVVTGKRTEFAADRVVLGAGTLSSSKIFLESLRRSAGEAPVLRGLMDNRQVLMPFVTWGMLRRQYDARTYQYHNLALGLQNDPAKEYVHGLITTLKSGLLHPIAQSVPFDLRSALYVFRNAHAALALINVNFHDTRRDSNTLSLEPGEGNSPPRLLVDYTPSDDEPERVRRTLRRIRKVLRTLGCVVPPGMMHWRPMGASVHYAGTLPMSREPLPLTTSPECRSHDVENLWFVDGTSFPFLPAKNLTFTLMANAMRVADAAF